jgi:hypothetical protein
VVEVEVVVIEVVVIEVVVIEVVVVVVVVMVEAVVLPGAFNGNSKESKVESHSLNAGAILSTCTDCILLLLSLPLLLSLLLLVILPELKICWIFSFLNGFMSMSIAPLPIQTSTSV